jgi:hypothetical protein
MNPTANLDALFFDEVFVTVTDAYVEPTEHTEIKHIFDFEAEGACLTGEGQRSQIPDTSSAGGGSTSAESFGSSTALIGAIAPPLVFPHTCA